MQTRKEALLEMQYILCGGTGVLTSSEIHPDIPLIHDVGHALKILGEVQHMGFGFFNAKTENGSVNFDGGGAMKRVNGDDGEPFSWCPFSGEIADTGYNVNKVRKAIEELLNL